MGHGHGPPWTHGDSYAFAKSIVTTGKPWCAQTECTVKNSTAMASFSSEKPFEGAVLVSTTDEGITGLRNWTETSATLAKNKNVWTATAPLLPGTTAWFLNFKTGDLIASTDFQQVTRTTPPKTMLLPDKRKEQKRAILFNQIDQNKDKQISQEEYVLFYKNVFPNLDKNHDSILNNEEFPHETALRFGDADEDGTLSKKEYRKIFIQQHDNLDDDSNGTVSLQEWDHTPG